MKIANKKTILITGGNRGIGEACAKLSFEQGFNVAVFDIDSVSNLPDKIYYQKCDVSDEDQVSTCVKKVIDHFGGIQVLVNNAGIQRYGTVSETTSEQWDEVIKVNLKSMFLCSHYVLPQMQKQLEGLIINMASAQSFLCQPNVAAYATSKAAILGLTRSIAVDYAPHVRSVAICPGTVDTPMLRNAMLLSPNPDEILKESEDMHLLKRIAQPNEIAEIVVFLSAGKGSFITGQAIRTDGGSGILIQGSKKN